MECKFHPISTNIEKLMNIDNTYLFTIEILSKSIADFELLNYFW